MSDATSVVYHMPGGDDEVTFTVRRAASWGQGVVFEYRGEGEDPRVVKTIRLTGDAHSEVFRWRNSSGKPRTMTLLAFHIAPEGEAPNAMRWAGPDTGSTTVESWDQCYPSSPNWRNCTIEIRV